MRNNDDFIYAWVNNDLGRKKQHGSHYLIKNDDVEFLCCYKKRQNPTIMGMRCLKTNLLVRDRRYGPEIPGDVYSVDFNRLSKYTSGALHETRLVDYEIVPCKNGKITRCLYDADGSKFYTEYRSCYYPDKNGYVNYDWSDATRASTHNPMTLCPTEGQCLKISEARYYSMPSEIRDDSRVVVLNNFFLLPTSLDLELPDSVWATARWQPCLLGWGVPRDMTDSSGHHLSYSILNLKGLNFIREMENRGESGRNAIAWKKKYDEWRAACDQIREASGLDFSRYKINLEIKNAWQDESGGYIRGEVACTDNPSCAHISLGSAWHRIYPRYGTEQQRFNLRGFLPPLQRKPRVVATSRVKRGPIKKKAQTYWYCPTFLTRDPTLNTEERCIVIDVGSKDDPTVSVIQVDRYDTVNDPTPHRVMWTDLRKAG